METLYKVLVAVCILFVAAGVIYVMYYLPQVPTTPAAVPQSTGCLQIDQAGV